MHLCGGFVAMPSKEAESSYAWVRTSGEMVAGCGNVPGIGLRFGGRWVTDLSVVMAGLDPATQPGSRLRGSREIGWVPGSSPGMTTERAAQVAGAIAGMTRWKRVAQSAWRDGSPLSRG